MKREHPSVRFGHRTDEVAATPPLPPFCSLVHNASVVNQRTERLTGWAPRRLPRRLGRGSRRRAHLGSDTRSRARRGRAPGRPPRLPRRRPHRHRHRPARPRATSRDFIPTSSDVAWMRPRGRSPATRSGCSRSPERRIAPSSTTSIGASPTPSELPLAHGGRVRFRPGAGDRPLRLAPLLRPAIELNWVRMVAAINRLDLESDRLHAHMFGATRSTFPDRLQSELRELQDDCCGHCGDRLRSRVEADHFVPWAH